MFMKGTYLFKEEKVMKMTKKFLALGMAVVMTTAMSSVAFAASTTKATTAAASNGEAVANSGSYTSGTITAEGTTTTPTISITVPTANAFVVNPYGLTATASPSADTNTETAATNLTAQIISPTYKITNGSDVGVATKLAVTGKVEGEAKFATSALKADDTAKDVLLFVRTKVNAAAVDTTDFEKDSAETMVVSTTKNEKDLGTIDAKTGTLVYQFDGAAVKVPAKAWAETDKVSATLVFTFVPQAATASTTQTSGDAG
jgi:hypothetical protein